ncbi:hypothetical protein V3M81_08890 [Trueperella pyogenes]|uniref:hypothetical protein n=1 Tax=Trueperella pyogenes TaxID=1661 RepID=UPI00345DADDA
MSEAVWPTAPVIRARWRDHGHIHYSFPSTYIYDPVTGEYFNPGTGKWHSPEYGEFDTVTEYVEAEALEKRTAEVRKLEKALQDKNRKLKGYREALKLANHTGRTNAYALGVQHGVTQERAKPRPHRYMHAYVRKVNSSPMWLAEVRRGAKGRTWRDFPTHEEAIDWATAVMRNLHENNYPR